MYCRQVYEIDYFSEVTELFFTEWHGSYDDCFGELSGRLHAYVTTHYGFDFTLRHGFNAVLNLNETFTVHFDTDNVLIKGAINAKVIESVESTYLEVAKYDECRLLRL